MPSDIIAPSSSRAAGQPARTTGGVVAVDRALSILDALTAAADSLSLSELAKTTGLVKPTVLRGLASLEKAAYVLRSADGRYQLGVKAFQLGASYSRSFRLETHVMPVLQKLTAASGETTSFNIREGDKRLCLYKIESPQEVRDFVDVRVVTFIDNTSTGMALEKTHYDAADGDRRPIYATSGINFAQLASVATPIYDVSDRLVGALTLSGPVQRFTQAKQKALVQLLATAADNLSLSIGGRRFPGKVRLIPSPDTKKNSSDKVRSRRSA